MYESMATRACKKSWRREHVNLWTNFINLQMFRQWTARTINVSNKFDQICGAPCLLFSFRKHGLDNRSSDTWIGSPQICGNAAAWGCGAENPYRQTCLGKKTRCKLHFSSGGWVGNNVLFFCGMVFAKTTKCSPRHEDCDCHEMNRFQAKAPNYCCSCCSWDTPRNFALCLG